MHHTLMDTQKDYAVRNRRRRIFRGFVQIMACIVVFCTTYALILPAITLEQKTSCGMEEHTHSESCYQQSKTSNLICTPDSLNIHKHTSECYDENDEQICVLADYPVHAHDASCRDAEGNLLCTLPEIMPHVHDENCYGPAVDVAHTHEETCYVTGDVLICAIPENHNHTDVCYLYPLVCTESAEAHAHISSCYEVGALQCTTLENHVHSDACSQAQLTCESVEEDHVHGDVCYTETNVCTISENHSHSDACYELVVICGMEDGDISHIHDSGYYSAEPELLCEIAENHTHTTQCYETKLQCIVAQEPELICKEPIAEVHIHGEDCFETVYPELSPVCENTSEDHVHDQSCYSMTCDLEEHVHSLSCYSDPEADLETAAQWEASFSHVTRTGNWPEDVLAIARTQLGYTESSRNYEVWDDDSTRGYTRYGDWYNIPYGDWCAMFVSFCLHYADVEDIPLNAHCASWIEALSEEELYRSADTFNPNPGDIVFFDLTEDGQADHVGLVAEILDAQDDVPAQIKTIEGNSSDRVQYVTYDLDDARILGYGDLTEGYFRFKAQQPVARIYSDEFVSVKVTYPFEARIPDDAELVVKKIQPEEEAELYDTRYQEAQELLDSQTSDITVTEIMDFQLYDISFQLEGEEITPNAAVSVEISFPAVETNDGAEVSVVHYAEEGPELPEIQEAVVDDSGMVNAAFETESFSLFAVVTKETYALPVIAMKQHTVSNNNIGSLAGDTLYAIVSGNYALSVDSGGKLITESVLSQENEGLLARWKFEKDGNGSKYFISTQIGSSTYYLRVSDSQLSLTTVKNNRTSFTASRSDSNLTLRSGNSSYIRLSSSGATLGSSSALSLYRGFNVLFDGKIGNAQYMGSQNKKYSGAEQIEMIADSNGYVTLPKTITYTNLLSYRINGWYDIVNREYYDESMLGQKVIVPGDTVFYPDYVATTYDIGQSSNLVTDQPDTSDFITTHLFDYNELFNIHSASYTGDTSNLYSTNSWSLDGGLGFVFSDWINETGNIGRVKNLGKINTDNTGGNRGENTNFAGTITPDIMNNDLMNALFTTNDDFIGRNYIGTGNWLYSFNKDTGFYYYDSALHAAAYNQSAGRFYVHNTHENVDNGNSLNDFLPFNEGKSRYQEKNTEVNYWLGMKSEINFYLPADSGDSSNVAANGQDMQFRFSGDDDVWVYIDGQLVLDMGGVHDIVYGEINFATGKYTIAQNGATNTRSKNGGMPGTTYGTNKVTTKDLPIKLEGGSEHTLTVYYLERGSSLSNCAIYFNIAPLYDLEIVKKDENRVNPLEGATFEVFDDKDCTIHSDLFVLDEHGNRDPQEPFTTDVTGKVVCKGLNPGRTYYIKETGSPENFPDVSDYIIRLDLTTSGQATVILLNSNDDTWTFADAHRYSETGHRVILSVYNAKFIGGEKEVYVEKVWADDEDHRDDKIVVHLYANGEPTGHSMTLSEANNWNGTFLNLPEKDSNGDPYRYTVQEEEFTGYFASYDYDTLETEDKQEAVWITNTPITEEAYLNLHVLKQWDDTVPADGRKEITMMLYTGVPGEDDAVDQLIYYDEIQLNLGNNWRGSFENLLPLTNGNYYLVEKEQQGFIVNYGVAESDIVELTIDGQVYQAVLVTWPEEDTQTVELTVTNALPMIDIPIEKRWDSGVPENNRKDISVTLYAVHEDSTEADVIQTIWITETNGWKGVFKDVPIPEDGVFYCIEENTYEFTISYSSPSNVVMNNVPKNVGLVEFQEDGMTPVELYVTNAPVVLLPSTGGFGTILYTMSGLLLMSAACCLLLYNHKRRREDVKSS